MKLVEICDVGNYRGIVDVKLFNCYIETVHIKIKTIKQKKTYWKRHDKKQRKTYFITKLLLWECCKEDE